MRLSETAIRRPVLACVMSLLVVLVGLVSFKQLTLREYPRIDEPLVTVGTRLLGASSEVIESQVTKPLEDSIAGIDGVDIITSISRTESSQITVRFKLSKEPDTAAAEVRDRVARVRGRLPAAVDEPVISKVEADATPTIWLAYTSDTLGPLELTDLVNRVVKPRLQTVPGVADVSVVTVVLRCASGSMPTSWLRTASPCRMWKTHCGGKTLKCQRAALKAGNVNSASPHAPI